MAALSTSLLQEGIRVDPVEALIAASFIIGVGTGPALSVEADGCDILGVDRTLSFRGREEQVSQAHRHYSGLFSSDKVSDARAHLFVFCGAPGSGKSRALLEASLPAVVDDVLVLFVTFNNKTVTCLDERTLLQQQIDAPIALRLLYSYARCNSLLSWDVWFDSIVRSRNVCLLGLSVESVLMYLRLIYNKAKVLLVIDEPFKFLSQGWMDEDCTLKMMRAAFSLQGSTMAVLFSAFSTSILNMKKTDSDRSILRVPLPDLPLSAAKVVIQDVFDQYGAPLADALAVSKDEAATLLLAMLGGTPRVLEFAHDALKKGKSLAEVVNLTGQQVALRYPTTVPFNMLQSALATTTLDLHCVKYLVDGMLLTLPQALASGLCVEDLDYPDKVILSSARLLACAYASPSSSQYPLGFNAALKALMLIPLCKPENLWEEFVRRLLIVRSFNGDGTPVEMSLSALFDPHLLISGNFDVKITRLAMSSNVMRFDVVPSPTDVQRLSGHVWAPVSSFESGVDSLLFEQVSTSYRKSYVCVGLQNKWSDDNNQTLSYTIMKKSVAHFYAKMLARGWKKDQVFMVFVIRRKIPQKLLAASGAAFELLRGRYNVAVIGLNDTRLWRWLSPTMMNAALHMQSIARHDTQQSFFTPTWTVAESAAYDTRVLTELSASQKELGVTPRSQRGMEAP
jgi:hypothetical protein